MADLMRQVARQALDGMNANDRNQPDNRREGPGADNKGICYKGNNKIPDRNVPTFSGEGELRHRTTFARHIKLLEKAVVYAGGSY